MIKRLGLLLFLVVLAAAGAAAWMYVRLDKPYRGFTEPEVFVDLPPGVGVQGIASRLAAAGVVPDPLTFRIAARLSGAERRLQAGEYRFADEASPAEVVGRLVRGDVAKKNVTFPEGLTIREMAGIFENSGLGTASDFVSAASDGRLIAELDPDARTLEGFLFPDTYALSHRATAAVAVQAMVARFEHAFDADLRAAGKEEGK